MIGKGYTDSLNFCSALPLKYNIENNNFTLLNKISTLNSECIVHICININNSCCDFSFNENGDIIGCENFLDDGWCQHKITAPIPISDDVERFFNRTLEYVILNDK